jgi:hypothetical protein
MKETLKNKQNYNSLDVTYCKAGTLDGIISRWMSLTLPLLPMQNHENPKGPQSPTTMLKTQIGDMDQRCIHWRSSSI